ncbi:MAG: metallophosphoesterase [Pseudomonadota bacterium]
MKIVVISDTHGGHERLGQLEGDILIHCGDVEHLFRDDALALQRVDNWFARQNFEQILCIGGNHDLSMEDEARGGRQPFRHATYLQDAALTYRSVKFYGAPWVPMLAGHAFFAEAPELATAWGKIPDDVDVLITHTPPAGILDVSSQGMVLGCKHLAKRLQNLSPRLHCFGHVHASVGSRVIRATTYVNATSVNSDFQIAHPPFEYEWPD